MEYQCYLTFYLVKLIDCQNKQINLFGMFNYGYYVLAECIREHGCVEDTNKIEAETKQKSLVPSFMFSKIRAVGVEFYYGEICNFKGASK